MRNILVSILASVVLAISASCAFAGESDFETANKGNQQILLSTIKQILTTEDSLSGLVDDSLLIGPALYYSIMKDEGLSKIGIATTFVILNEKGKKTDELEGRIYRGDDILLFLKADTIKKILKDFYEGKVRHARSVEQGAIFSFLQLELAPEAFVVMDTHDDALLFYLNDKKIFFIDLVSEYINTNLEAGQTDKRRLEPTDLLSAQLLDDNDTYIENIDFNEMRAYSDKVIAVVKSFFKRYDKPGFDLIVEITLFKNNNSEISVGTKPYADKEMTNELKGKLTEIESPRTKKIPISWRLLFQVNNGPANDNTSNNTQK